LLKRLGLPEINLVATDTEVTGTPAGVTAGRYLVTMENQTADTEVEIYMVAPPAGLTIDQAIQDMNGGPGATPDWAYEATFAGGPNPYGGQTDAAVVNLTAGDWWVVAERYGEPEVWTISPLSVTGEFTVAESIASTVPVALREYTFVLPGTMTAGEQIWELSNTGEQPHFIVLAKLPDGTTFDELMTFFMALEAEESAEGSPVAASPSAGSTGLSEEDFAFVYDSSIISAGQTTWVQVGLEAGTYGLFCWFSDHESGAPHLAMGMLGVFTVA
jgi:hypothetical protein